MSSQEEPAKEIECPICAKEFAANAIEAHVSKCLFLNESTSSSQESSKRASISRGDNAPAKKAKSNFGNQLNFKAGSTSPSTSPSASRSKFLSSSQENNPNNAVKI